MNPPTIGLLLLLLAQTLLAEDKPVTNINVAMMESTCKIVGNGSIGTGFIIGRPDSENPEKNYFTLVTAQHVLAAAQGEKVTLVLRRLKDSGDWERLEVPLRIRDSAKELWKKHADVDLAVLYVDLPDKAIRALVTTDLLLTDEKLAEYEISPGTELLCLGYPHEIESNKFGFPILRSGKIASYPLLPTKQTQGFLFDFSVFPGNSGGPVYLYETSRVYGGSMHVGSIVQGIIGVVTSEVNSLQATVSPTERREFLKPLALGQVIPASFIAELISSLPDPGK